MRTTFLATMLLAVAGCGTPPATPLTQSAPRRVEMLNLTSRTQAASPTSLTVEQLSARASDLAAAGKTGHLTRLVARYPDVALELLRTTPPQDGARADRQAVAAAYDHLFVTGVASWRAALASMAATPGETQAAADTRQVVRSLIEQGRFAQACEAGQGGRLAAPFLAADALRLRGIALMLDNKPAEAAAAWQDAQPLAAGDACAEAELDLLTCEALRRGGRVAPSALAFARAAARACGVRDPVFWQRLLELKPADAAWPSAVQERFAPASAAAGAAAFDEGEIWRQLGQWRLEQGEEAASLLAFAQAQSLSTSDLVRGQSRIGQARALAAMGQFPPAVAILSSLADAPQPAVAGQALAVLGVVSLQQGRGAEGMAMLQRAVENANVRWDEFSTAQADLALAYLSAGSEAKGLPLMHEAQSQFQRDGRIADLCQCLDNEAAYLKQSGHGDQAAAIVQKIVQLEAAP